MRVTVYMCVGVGVGVGVGVCVRVCNFNLCMCGTLLSFMIACGWLLSCPAKDVILVDGLVITYTH